MRCPKTFSHYRISAAQAGSCWQEALRKSREGDICYGCGERQLEVSCSDRRRCRRLDCELEAEDWLHGSDTCKSLIIIMSKDQPLFSKCGFKVCLCWNVYFPPKWISYWLLTEVSLQYCEFTGAITSLNTKPSVQSLPVSDCWLAASDPAPSSSQHKPSDVC